MAIWKTIPILDGKYEASDDGRVRKKARKMNFIKKQINLDIRL